MFRILKDLNKLLTDKQMRGAVGVVCSMLFAALCETAVLAVIYAFISGIVDYEHIVESDLYRVIVHLCGNITIQQYILVLSVALGVLCLGKGIVALETGLKNYRFSNNLYYSLSQSLYVNYVHSDYAQIINKNSSIILKAVTQDTVNTYVLVRSVMSLF